MPGRSEKPQKAKNAIIGGAIGSAAAHVPIASQGMIAGGGYAHLAGEGKLATLKGGAKGLASMYDPRYVGDFGGKYGALLGGAGAAGAGIGAIKGRGRNSNIPDGAKRGKRL